MPAQPGKPQRGNEAQWDDDDDSPREVYVRLQAGPHAKAAAAAAALRAAGVPCLTGKRRWNIPTLLDALNERVHVSAAGAPLWLRPEQLMASQQAFSGEATRTYAVPSGPAKPAVVVVNSPAKAHRASKRCGLSVAGYFNRLVEDMATTLDGLPIWAEELAPPALVEAS